MSTNLFPLAVWPEGILQARLPANDNALRIEAFGRGVLSDSTTAQPVSPADGDIYIIPSGATGAQWSAFSEGDVALYRGSWYAFAPVGRPVVNVAGVLKYWTGSAWTGLAAGESAAEDVTYDNSTSGLAATDVQAAIDEVAGVITSAATQCIPVACSDESTALTIGNAKVTFHVPYDFTLTEVIGGLTTAQTSGSILTVDINAAGSSILSTKLTIDNTEETSITAATPAVIGTPSLNKGQKVTIDIDQIGDGTAKGLKVYLIGVPA